MIALFDVSGSPLSCYDALFDVWRSSSLSLSSRCSVLKREAARHHHLLVLESRRNPPFLFVNTNAVACTVGRALLVFSKKIKMLTSTPPYTPKTVACFFTLIVFNGPGDVRMS
jgi:hypothetical protein